VRKKEYTYTIREITPANIIITPEMQEEMNTRLAKVYLFLLKTIEKNKQMCYTTQHIDANLVKE
jgi:hypothetical protein